MVNMVTNTNNYAVNIITLPSGKFQDSPSPPRDTRTHNSMLYSNDFTGATTVQLINMCHNYAVNIINSHLPRELNFLLHIQPHT